jgi:glycosyltransferase involved in cell wall biosynthesis
MSLMEETCALPRSRETGRPLRILLVTQASGGGVGRHFLDLAQELTAKGVQVAGIYAPRKLDTLFRKRLAAGGLPPMHQINMRRAIHPFDAADLWRLICMIRRMGPFDLIHGHSSKGGALARLAARRLGIPSVYTSHAIVTLDPTLPAWQRRVYGRIERWLARRTDAMIAVSDDEADHIGELGIDARKVHVVPNGIPQIDFPSRDVARSRLGISPGEVVIGFVGRLSTQKAPEVLLDAFASVLERHANARLVMVGSGPLDATIREHVRNLDLGSRVSLLGDVVATDVMPAFDLFCLSSRYEAMPYVYLEALAAGLPIVSTRVGGATMCVEPGENGLLVPPEDLAALSTALAALVQDAQLRACFAAASARMAARFTAKQMVEQTLRIYDHVLEKSTTSRQRLVLS